MSSLEQTLFWKPLECTTDLVREREGHCAALATSLDNLTKVAVVVGGYVEGSFEPYALASNIASDPSEGSECVRWYVCGADKICESDGLSMCSDIDGQQFVFFGGIDGDTYEPRNTLTIAKWQWHVENDRCVINLPQFTNVATIGVVPSPRWRHAAAFVPEVNWMFVFGGITASEEQSNDLFVLHLGSLCWYPVDVSATVRPSPRFLTCWVHVPSEVDQGTILLLYGGACFVDGNQISQADAWELQAYHSEAENVFHAKWRPVEANMHLPAVNGHVGFRFAGSTPEVCFLGGKDFSEGTNDLIFFKRASDGKDATWVVRRCGPRSFDSVAPDWRYTPALVWWRQCESETVEGWLIGGNCRHPDGWSTFSFRNVCCESPHF